MPGQSPLAGAISPQQLEQMMYPYGRGQMNYGGTTPVGVNQTSQTVNGVQPGGVSFIGDHTVKTGAAIDDSNNAALGVTPGQMPATGIPDGASAGPAADGAAYGSIASAAIGAIAQTASDWAKRNAQVQTLKNSEAIPQLPQAFTQPAVFSDPPPSV